jgi:hypothetical protein
VRSWLTLLWSASFTGAILSWVYLKMIVGIGPETSGRLMEELTTQYAPYLGAVLAYHFAASAGQRGKRNHASSSYYLAITMSSLWNFLLLSFMLRACFNPDFAPDASKSIRAFIPKLSWLVAPAIGFFFGKPEGGTR